jgi:hypothetical protein
LDALATGSSRVRQLRIANIDVAMTQGIIISINATDEQVNIMVHLPNIK